MRIEDLPMMIQIVAIVALTAGISAIILEEFQGSGAYSANVNQTITDGIGGLTETTSWLDLIALIVMAGIILGIVLRQFGGGVRGGRGGY